MTMTSYFSPWSSARLSYRAVERHDETGVLLELGQDAEAFINAVPFVPSPQGSEAAKSHREFIQSCYLGVIICLNTTATDKKNDPMVTRSHGEAIGFLTLIGPGPGREHHGRGDVVISLLAQHRGKGYGSEAIQWALCWAFTCTRFHRVGIAAVDFNERAKKLYMNLGFVQEAVRRDFVWKCGRWWDVWEGAMLEDEWREKYGASVSYASYIPVRGT